MTERIRMPKAVVSYEQLVASNQELAISKLPCLLGGVHGVKLRIPDQIADCCCSSGIAEQLLEVGLLSPPFLHLMAFGGDNRMETAHELFIHELGDMLDAEQKLVEALGKQAEESSRPELQKAFQSHQAQTQKQVERLQQCFELLGEEPEETECKGIKGLIEEHDTFTQEEDPAEDLLDIFNVGAASKVESYEICAYESLINLAQQMEHTKVERLLNQNLKEEQQTLKKMQGFAKKLKPENLGMEGEEEEGEEEDGAVYAGSDNSTSQSSRRGAKRSSSAGSRSRRGRAA